MDNAQVNKNLNKLNVQITQINSQLGKKRYQQQNIKDAINDADSAIIQSDEVLTQLNEARSYNLQQLKQINIQVSESSKAVAQAQAATGALLNQAYHDLQYTKNMSDSLLAADNTAQTNIKKHYLVAMLVDKQNGFHQLQDKLTQLESINTKLEAELLRLDNKLGITSDYKHKLVQDKSNQVKQIKELGLQISNDQQKLNNLKQKQTQLNKLILTLGYGTKIEQENTSHTSSKAQSNKFATTDNSSNSDSNSIDDSQNNSLFLKHRLIRPFNAKIAINFGAMRGDVKNNGVLFDSLTTSSANQIYAIAAGKVMYVGQLSGFGDLVIIDHGNNYMSIYSGVMPNVSRGESVGSGQVIAMASGKSDKLNQPMGGVYFELRHLGRPVNPQLFIN
jgi:septal ring factor EnvC (AmiA/AmiB activator)